MNWLNLPESNSRLAGYVRRNARPLCITAGAAAVGAAAYNVNKHRIGQIRPRLSNTLIEAVSGAVGEVAQIVLLYPLDTIKVRCQAASIGTRAAVADIARRSGGSLLIALQILYAGALPAAATSILVGAVHYVCFCTTKRVLLDLPVFSSSSSCSRRNSPCDGTSCGAPEGITNSNQQTEVIVAAHHHRPHVVHSHGVLGSHYLPHSSLPEDSQEPSGEQQAAAAAATTAAGAAGEQADGARESSVGGLGGLGRKSKTAAAGEAGDAADIREAAVSEAGAAAGSAAEAVAEEEARSGAVNVLAAVLTAAATAVVEAPLELFRHNSQAGQFQGNFVKEMWKVMRHQGPGALYWGFVPYCFESWPYDVTELLVVGGLKDARSSIAAQQTRLGTAVASMPAHMYDIGVGAVAGTAAVLISMPFDCIKTYMQTHGQEMAGAGVLGSAGAFWKMGRTMVQQRGPSALYVGLVPRLMHQVPGAMVCWWAIEGCHRYLQQLGKEPKLMSAAPEGH